MERKSSMVAVTTEEVESALARARTVSSEEEKVLRMRYGAKVARTAPLTSVASGNPELEDELLLIEMQLFRAHFARRTAPPTQGTRNPAKEKIVRALRKKR